MPVCIKWDIIDDRPSSWESPFVQRRTKTAPSDFALIAGTPSTYTTSLNLGFRPAWTHASWSSRLTSVVAAGVGVFLMLLALVCSDNPQIVEHAAVRV